MWEPPSVANTAWQMVDGAYEQYWGPSDREFRFRVSTRSEGWPGIDEPPHSTAYDLGTIFAASGPTEFADGEARVNREVHAAMLDAFAPDERLIALDWQHPTFWVWPHRMADNGGEWWVPPFPNGDYFAFLTADMSEGTFGHPWEESLCVWGDRLRPAVEERLGTWLPVLRGGQR